MIAVAYFTATLEHGPPTHPRRGARKALQTLLLPALCLSCWCLLGLLAQARSSPCLAASFSAMSIPPPFSSLPAKSFYQHLA